MSDKTQRPATVRITRECTIGDRRVWMEVEVTGPNAKEIALAAMDTAWGVDLTEKPS